MAPVRSKGSVSPTTQAIMYMMIIRSNDITMLMTRHADRARCRDVDVCSQTTA